MADNVLRELFSAIAFEIREGLGPIGKIKPADFPAKTKEIVDLLNSGGGTGGNTNYVVASGTFKAAGTGVETITHNLGVVPDYFMIQWASLGKAPETPAVISASGYSSRFFSANPDAIGTALIYRSDSGTMASLPFGADYPIDGDRSFSGHPHNATATTIMVGTDDIPLDAAQGVSYTWCAIGGLV